MSELLRAINQYGLTLDAQLALEVDAVRQRFDHPTVKGTVLEQVISKKLGSVLSPAFRVGNGQIIDSKDRMSGQIDLVLFDEHQPLHSWDGAPTLFLAEAVRAAIEVKTVLSPSTLDRLVAGARRLKLIRPISNHGDSIPCSLIHGEWLRFYLQIPYVVFAYESTAEPAAILDKLASLPRENWSYSFEFRPVSGRSAEGGEARKFSVELSTPLVDAVLSSVRASISTSPILRRGQEMPTSSSIRALILNRTGRGGYSRRIDQREAIRL